jgi:hypothetical protein
MNLNFFNLFFLKRLMNIIGAHPKSVGKYIVDMVAQTIDQRDNDNIKRNDLMQYLIDVRKHKTGDTKGMVKRF